MTRYVLEKQFSSHAPLSANVLALAGMFGIGANREKPINILDRIEMDIQPGQIVFITGGSGAGKSVILRLLAQQIPDALCLSNLAWPPDKPVIDCFNRELQESLYWLSMAGLSDAFALLRLPEELSEGQRYRFRLALALAQHAPVVVIDEFCSCLDRITAAVVAHNIRRFADRFAATFLLAASHDDLLEDLCPDVVVVKYLGSGCDVYYPDYRQDTQEGQSNDKE